MVNLPTSSTSHFVNFHFVNIDQMGIDKVGIDEVGINRKYHGYHAVYTLSEWSLLLLYTQANDMSKSLQLVYTQLVIGCSTALH